MEKIIKFKKLHQNAEIPTYAHDGDIGLDVKCVSVEYDPVHDAYIYGTGLACETTGHMGVLGMMRSSVYKHGDAYLTNAVGLIDSDQYRGEIKYIYRNVTHLYERAQLIALINWNRLPWWKRMFTDFDSLLDSTIKVLKENPLVYAPYQVGDVVGQLVPMSFDTIKIEEVKELSETERGEGGFGSTDKKKPTKKSSKPRKVSKKV